MTPAQKLQDISERWGVCPKANGKSDVDFMLAHISTLEARAYSSRERADYWEQRFVDEKASLESELQQVKVERDGMREALTRLLLHDAGCVVSGEAGSGNPECCGYCFAKAALTPAPAARTEAE